MIKKSFVICVVACFVMYVGFMFTTMDQTGQMKNEYITHADMELFDYTELKDNANVIAKVIVKDDLTSKNSNFIYDEYDEDRPILDYYAIREVEILEIYKDEFNLLDSKRISVTEAASMDENALYHYEGYEPMKKGECYILFLSNDTMSGEWSIISCENGRVALNQIEETEDVFFEIAAKAIVEYETELSAKAKTDFISSEITRIDNDDKASQNCKTEEHVSLSYEKQEDGSYDVYLASE